MISLLQGDGSCLLCLGPLVSNCTIQNLSVNWCHHSKIQSNQAQNDFMVDEFVFVSVPLSLTTLIALLKGTSQLPTSFSAAIYLIVLVELGCFEFLRVLSQYLSS